MKFGIWFSTNPIAVVSTYFTNDQIAVDIDSDFLSVGEWKRFVRDIEFCVITILNHKNLPGFDNEKIRDLIEDMKKSGIRVYLAVSCLLGTIGGPHDHLVDSNTNISRTWYCPCDPDIIPDISKQIIRICKYYNPTGILLWNATFPNENFCYKSKCEGCLSEYNEFDVDKRCSVLTDFLVGIINAVKKIYPDIKMCLKIDVEGRGNIEYQYGVKLKSLGELDEIVFHVRKEDENTLKRVYNLCSESKSLKFDTTLYISAMNKNQFKSLSDKLQEKFEERDKPQEKLEKNELNLLVFSPYESLTKEVVTFLEEKKMNLILNKFFDRVTMTGIILTLVTTLLAFLNQFFNRVTMTGIILTLVTPLLAFLKTTLITLSIIMFFITVIFGCLDLLHRNGHLSFIAPYLCSIIHEFKYRKSDAYDFFNKYTTW